MLRITGGEFRGRLIAAPPGDATRPTQSRLRQALFNSLQASIPDAKVLDLFAGSGALAFEALSRGAALAVLVENARPAIKAIQKNVADLKVQDRVRLISLSVDELGSELEPLGPFDVVLADPPYADGWEIKLLEELPWDQLLVPGGFLSLEWGTQKSKPETLPEETAFLVKVREKTYGETILTTYQRREL